MNFATLMKQLWTKSKQFTPKLRGTFSTFKINMIMVKKSERIMLQQEVIYYTSNMTAFILVLN